MLLGDLTSILILREAAADGLAIADFARGKGMDGTGPYQFVSYQDDDRVELTRKSE